MSAPDPFGWSGATIDGKFAVESVVGEGGFGVVYRGTHLGFRDPVAIKCLKLPPSLTGEQRESFLASFTEEARLLHRLSRANAGIVQALDVGAATAPRGIWTPYIVMEWLQGRTLESHIASHRASGAEAAIDLLDPAAAALEVAHAQGVAHRDIKPANLFLATIGGKTAIKILDFGIAKVVGDSALTLTQAFAETAGAVRAFSPQYAAPEQFDPRFGATGPWTDVYSFALVLLEAASGQPAYTGTSEVQLYVQASDASRRPSLRSCGVSATAPVEAVLCRALAVDPKQRFAGIAEMRRALCEARSLGGAPTVIAGAAAAVPEQRASSPFLEDAAARAPGATTQRRGENRLCTIVLAEIGGLDDVARRMDPEEAREMHDGCFEALTSCVERLDGKVERVTGGRIVAVFGVPRADENDAERAVNAALRMQAALARVRVRDRDRRRVTLSLRAGIDTGWVFSGGGARGTRRDESVTGEPVNAAVRLLARVDRAGIVIGQATYRHVSGLFDLEPLHAGVDPKDAAYSVLGRSQQRGIVCQTDFHGIATKLVGRAAEMQRIDDAVETALSERRAQFLTLTGAPGLGRSRLLRETLTRISNHPRGFFVLSARSERLASGTTYALVRALLRGRFAVNDEDDETVARAKVLAALQSLSEETGDADRSANVAVDSLVASAARLPEHADLLAGLLAAKADSVSEAASSLVSDDEWRQAKNRTSAAIAGVIASVLERAPVAVLCDDLHWADDASLDVLDELHVRLFDSPLVVVCTARPDLYERRPHWGEGREDHARLDLAPLARRHIEEMVRDRLRSVRDLSAHAVSTLVERAAGSPLVLSESLHLLVDDGVIDPARWVLHEDRVGGLGLPATVQGIMQARLDRLAAHEREVVEIASVVGETFWERGVDHLRSVSATAAPTTASSTAEILGRLRAKQVVRAREVSTIPGEREYVFAERAMCEVAYETLSRRVRRAHHRAAAEWLSQRAADGQANALLAHHFDRADLAAQAVVAYSRAGARAASFGQNAEASRHYARAAELLDGACGPDVGRESAADDNDTRAPGEERRVAAWRERTRLRSEFADVLRRLGRLDDAQNEYELARASIVREERRRTHEWWPADALEPARWDARIDWGQVVTLKSRGDNAGACDLAVRAIARAGAAGSKQDLPGMYALLAGIHRRLGDLDACRDAARAGFRVARSLTVRDSRWRAAASELLIALGAVFYSQKALVRAERCYLQASRFVDEASNPRALSFALNDVAAVRYERGDLAGALQLFRRSLALKEREGDLHQVAIALSNVAEVELRLGQSAAALEHATSSVRLAERADARADLPDFYRNLAEALRATGDIASAVAVADKSVALALLSGGRVYLRRSVDTLAHLVAAARDSEDASLAALGAATAKRALGTVDDEQARATLARAVE